MCEVRSFSSILVCIDNHVKQGGYTEDVVCSNIESSTSLADVTEKRNMPRDDVEEAANKRSRKSRWGSVVTESIDITGRIIR